MRAAFSHDKSAVEYCSRIGSEKTLTEGSDIYISASETPCFRGIRLASGASVLSMCVTAGLPLLFNGLDYNLISKKV